MESTVSEVGRNAWRVAHARRAAVLIDAEAYFTALREAFERAERSIFILGWDIHSRIRLAPDPACPDLRDLLTQLVTRQPRLRIRILDWDFTMLLSNERESLPWVSLDTETPSRVSFRLDGRHPVGACHHQKIVVVDDALAFVGGLDLTDARWDTTEHRVDDPRRRGTTNEGYPPFHDIQMAVDGAAAAALGDLARMRWQRALGRDVRRRRPKHVARDLWPPSVRVDLEDVDVAIARTEPAYDDRPEVREVERLYVDSLRAARRFVYLENQYLTSRVVADVLCERLREPDGPEIVIVSPRECSGWLEQSSMGVLRFRLVKQLQDADVHGRFHLLYPRLPGNSVRLNVHSKFMVSDGTLLRVGSANLSNRSMGFDTECDLQIESHGDARIQTGIESVLHRLLGEHLGVDPAVVAATLRETGGRLADTIARLDGAERTLEVLDPGVPDWIDNIAPESLPTDPERPLSLFRGVESWTPELLRDPHRRTLLPLVGGAAVLCLLALGWQWAGGVDLATIREGLESIERSPFAALWVIGTFGVASLVVFPITPVILATILVFGGAVGACYAVLGSLFGATLTYALGRHALDGVIRGISGRRAEALRVRLRMAGLLTIAAVRLVPVAPFTVVNVVAGASRVPFVAYLGGTFLGMIPGITAMALADGAARAAKLSPIYAVPAALVALGLVAWLWKRRRARREREAGAARDELAGSLRERELPI